MIKKDQNTRDHSAWTIGNEDPIHEVCIPNSIPRACESSKKYGRKERGHEGEKFQTRPN